MSSNLTPYAGQNVEELVAECEAGHREYSRTIPTENLQAFNPSIKTYGALWCDVVDKDYLPWLIVVAGVSGNMTGVPIAQFSRIDFDAAKQYARDFERGMCFVLCNGPRWSDYINAMQQCRKVNADVYSKLNSLSRSSGISSVTGDTITRHELLAGYLSGLSASQM